MRVVKKNFQRALAYGGRWGDVNTRSKQVPGIGLVAFMTASAKIAHKGANLIKRFLLLSLSDVTPVVATNIADIVTKITTIESVDANQNGRRLIELLITLNNSFLNTVQYEVTKTTNTHHSNNIFALLSVDCTERKGKESWGRTL